MQRPALRHPHTQRPRHPRAVFHSSALPAPIPRAPAHPSTAHPPCPCLQRLPHACHGLHDPPILRINGARRFPAPARGHFTQPRKCSVCRCRVQTILVREECQRVSLWADFRPAAHAIYAPTPLDHHAQETPPDARLRARNASALCMPVATRNAAGGRTIAAGRCFHARCEGSQPAASPHPTTTAHLTRICVTCFS